MNDRVALNGLSMALKGINTVLELTFKRLAIIFFTKETTMGMASIIKHIKVPASMTKIALKAKKHAPEIMVITGAVLVVGSAVVACKQTLKAHEVLEKANADLDEVNKALETCNEESYSPEDAKKDRRNVYIKTGWEFVKLYGPAVIGGVVGFSLIFGAHKILRGRNAALTLAYTNLLNSYNNYRKRIASEFGEDKERLLAAGAETTDISVVNEDGTVEEVKNASVVHDKSENHSPYARIFEATNKNWSKNPATNLFWLRSQEKFANEKLQAEGFLFLNDVYEMLGYPRTSEGQIVGWIFDPNNVNHDGDNHVDFGIYDLLYNGKEKAEFINGYNPCIWLDFNVDGVVYDLI